MLLGKKSIDDWIDYFIKEGKSIDANELVELSKVSGNTALDLEQICKILDEKLDAGDIEEWTISWMTKYTYRKSKPRVENNTDEVSQTGGAQQVIEGKREGCIV